MWKLKNNLNVEILKYFLLFSVLILGILWLFQFLFFDSFYRSQRIRDIQVVATKISREQNTDNYYEVVNNLAFDKSVCIEILNNNYDSLYKSTFFGKGCFTSNESTRNYKFDFISNSYNEKAYELINERFNNKTLVYAVKLRNNRYAFINTSLEAVDGTKSLIKKEFVVISITIFIYTNIYSFCHSFF